MAASASASWVAAVASASASSSSYGARRSTRTRRGGKTVEFRVSSSDTVYRVKMKLFQECMDRNGAVQDVNAYRIYYGGEELAELQRTMADYGVKAGAQLEADSKGAGSGDGDGFDPSMLLEDGKGGNGAVELGFSGTALGGGAAGGTIDLT